MQYDPQGREAQQPSMDREWLERSLADWQATLTAAADDVEVWKATQMVELRKVQLAGGTFTDLPWPLRSYRAWKEQQP